MFAAAKDEGAPLCLAALPLSQNSPPGLGSCDSELHRVIELANSLKASGLAASLYDEGRRSRSTAKERDQETGLDFFGARYYGSGLGRFTSPDNGVDQDTTNPQRWNLYSYGRNNPLIGADDDGRTYNVCDANGKNCSKVDDKTFEAEQNNDQQNGESLANGTLSHTDANGTSVKDGSFTHDPDIAGDPAANTAAMGNIGNQGIVAMKWFGEQMAYNVLGGVAGHGVGLAVDAFQGYRAAGVLAEVLTKAGSAVGNTSIQVASRGVAEQAAKEWVGAGAREIVDRGTGKVVGEISADRTKVARYTSAETKGYINLESKHTGSNLPVR